MDSEKDLVVRSRAGDRKAFSRLVQEHGEVASRVADVGAADPALDQERRAPLTKLADAMSALPTRDREVLALRYFADLSEAETASALDCPVGTVKSRT